MDTKAKQKLVSQLVDIIHQVKDPSFANENNRRSRILGGQGFLFSLVDEAADQYDEVVKLFLKQKGWSSKFSESHVDKAINQLLAGAVRNIREGSAEQTAEYVAERVDRLIDEFESFTQKHVVYYPLAGIIMRIDELKIGNVTLISMTDLRFKELIKNIELEINKLQIPQEEKNNALQNQIQELLPRLAGKVCAVLETVAEPERAMEQVVEACRPVLDLLRYFMHMIHRGTVDRLRMAVGAPDEVLRNGRNIIVIQADFESFTATSQSMGMLAAFSIDKDIEDRMIKLGLPKMSGIMIKQSATKFEKALLRGIRSFGKSYTHTEKEDRFLSLIACLENFIKTDRDERVAKTVAEGVAFVLGTNPKDRRSLRDTVKASYDIRSAIVHGRAAEVLDAELNKLRSIVGDFVAYMIEWAEKFNSQEDLVEWIDDQKFSDKSDQQNLLAPGYNCQRCQRN